MKICYGDLYTVENLAKYDWVGFTANSVVKRDGSLVMGAGNAKQVRDMFDGLDKRLGHKVKRIRKYFIISDSETKVFALQTKLHYKDNSPIDLVEESCQALRVHAENNPDQLFAVPCPGVNHGGLSVEDVMVFLEKMPDNVYIWFKDDVSGGMLHEDIGIRDHDGSDVC